MLFDTFRFLRSKTFSLFLMFYCACQKHANSEVQKPNNVCVFADFNHRQNPCYLPLPKWTPERWEMGTNLFIFGLTKPTLLWLNSLDFRSSSSSSLEKNVSLGISSNSLPSLLGLEPIRCKRDWTAKEAAEARGALDRAAPGHQVSRLWKKWTRKTN